MDFNPPRQGKNIVKILVVGPLLTNCCLLISKDELLIIDPGGEAGRATNQVALFWFKNDGKNFLIARFEFWLTFY